MAWSWRGYFADGILGALLRDDSKEAGRDAAVCRLGEMNEVSQRKGFVAQGVTFVEVADSVYEVLFAPDAAPEPPAALSESDVARFVAMIEEGRKRGCHELRIIVREKHAHLFSAKRKTIELPLDVWARIENCCEAGLIIQVTYVDYEPPCAVAIREARPTPEGTGSRRYDADLSK